MATNMSTSSSWSFLKEPRSSLRDALRNRVSSLDGVETSRDLTLWSWGFGHTFVPGRRPRSGYTTSMTPLAGRATTPL